MSRIFANICAGAVILMILLVNFGNEQTIRRSADETKIFHYDSTPTGSFRNMIEFTETNESFEIDTILKGKSESGTVQGWGKQVISQDF